MKIISIKSLNINSLKGTTEINFAELTKDSALFAITGPTGSGKSTILDIISCALYGRTSRLKNPNDLMSRHCGEAYCEVEFEIRAKTYRSSWSQKRARNKHDGKFQTAKMELIDLADRKPLPLKSREVPKKVEELSGLDFGRFTQSMLLAQGSFDAFLKADEKERSSLLEKITGTQIYAEISKAIFDKHRNFAQEMESDQKILESITLLDEVVVEEKQNLLNKNIIQKKKTDVELTELSLALTYLQRVSELRLESKKHEEEFLHASKLKEEHKDSFGMLDLANKALNVSSTFTAHIQLKRSVSEDKAQAIKLRNELQVLEEDIKLQDKEYSLFKKEFEEATLSFEAESQKLKQAREIQTQENQTQISIDKDEASLKSKNESLAKLTKTLNVLIEKHRDIQKQVESKKLYLKANKQDEKLLSALGIVAQNIKLYKEEKTNLVKCGSDLKDSTAKLKSEDVKHKLMQEEVNRLSVIFKEIDAKYKKLEVNSLNDLEAEEGVVKSLEDTQELMRAYESYTKFVKSKDTEITEHEKNSELYSSMVQTREVSEAHIGEIKKHIETLRDKKEKEQLLKKYEDDRKSLVDGEACSLCGSTKHPFVNNLDEIHIDKTQETITTQSKELRDKESELKALESRISVTETKMQTSKLELEKLNKEICTLEGLFKIYSFEATSVSESNLQVREEELSKQLDGIKQNRIEKEKVLKQRDKANKQLQEQENSLHELNITLQKGSSDKEQLTRSLVSYTLKREELVKSLESHLKEFELELDIQTVDEQYQVLLSRKALYEQTAQELKTVEDELNKCTVDKKESETKADALRGEIERVTQSLKEQELSLKILSVKRVEILNVADLDAHEKEITTKYKSTQTKEQTSKTSLNESRVKSEERLANKKSLDAKIVEDEKKLELVQNELEALYKQNDFKDASALERATLSRDKKEELDRLCKKIEDRYKQAQTLKIETIKKLQEYEKEPASDKPKEELETLQSLLKQKVDSLQESIGSDKKELELNQGHSDKYKERIASLEVKKESFKVWVKLNELVGSADGTKFKKFAQGITLDQLINLANQHLSVLSLRYTLARNQEKLLELEVIDAYQGNVVRPVSTLSGGESFIVSLALALGLSELASQKIAIDSLFLDEGFGTLDAESLETALNALNLLQSGGKMVGVISHVEALKERIPLQIRVVPNGDGTSYVEIQ